MSSSTLSNSPLTDSTIFKITTIETGRFTKLKVAPCCHKNLHYPIGSHIQFRIPEEYGIQELNGKIGTIIQLFPDDPNRVSIDIDSTKFSRFIEAHFSSLNPPTISLSWSTPTEKSTPRNWLSRGSSSSSPIPHSPIGNIQLREYNEKYTLNTPK